MAKGNEKSTPIRWTKAKASYELTWAKWLALLTGRAMTWGARRFVKPTLYHPLAVAGIPAFVWSYAFSPWLTAALMWGLLIYQRGWPYSYRHHVQPRVESFFAGFRYRWRPRRNLKACKLLRDIDPIPTISRVTKRGCVTDVQLKMCPGHTLDWWREDAAALAQTYNARSVKINVVRRNDYRSLQWRKTTFTHKPPYVQLVFEKLTTKNQWLVLSFLTEDPFSLGMGIEYLDYHHNGTMQPVVATYRTGEAQLDDLAAHTLAIAMTRWGKSNRIRARLYAHRHNIAAGLLEVWLIDGKGGVEGAFLEHYTTRHAYGDAEAETDAYDPEEFDRLLRDAVKVLRRRQLSMRGVTDIHIATKDEPWLHIVIDEILVLVKKTLEPGLRNSIAANISLIQEQGLGCGVSIDASSQRGELENLPFRKGFTRFELGKVEQGIVDMIFGTGWWLRGARCDELEDDLKGSFYIKTDSTMAPEVIRYPVVPRQQLNTPQRAGKSKLWTEQDVYDMGFA